MRALFGPKRETGSFSLAAPLTPAFSCARQPTPHRATNASTAPTKPVGTTPQRRADAKTCLAKGVTPRRAPAAIYSLHLSSRILISAAYTRYTPGIASLLAAMRRQLGENAWSLRMTTTLRTCLRRATAPSWRLLTWLCVAHISLFRVNWVVSDTATSMMRRKACCWIPFMCCWLAQCC